MTTLVMLEERRQRGLHEVHELESLRRQRPLLQYEERALRKNIDLVQSMETAISSLLAGLRAAERPGLHSMSPEA